MKKILVAEDNDSNYMLMTYILKRHYDFVRACNGQEAVAMADDEKPDLILMDIKMPLMDGLEATRLIKSRQPQLPIIAITANAFDVDRQSALAAGCDDFLSKPVSAEKCLSIIRQFVGE
ncbi:MAG: response regulator [Prevotella sp.]|nr:response regulator [Prevotella sp.]